MYKLYRGRLLESIDGRVSFAPKTKVDRYILADLLEQAERPARVRDRHKVLADFIVDNFCIALRR